MQIPPMMPRKTLEPKVALSDAGADSAVYMALATSSPPTLKPCAQARRWIRVLGFGFWGLGLTCRALLMKKKSGAKTPMLS